MTGYALQHPQHCCTETIVDDVMPAVHGLAYCVVCRVILLPTFLLACGKICQWQRWSQVLGVHQYVLMLLGFGLLCLLQRHTSSFTSKLKKRKQEKLWRSTGDASKPILREAIAGDEPVIIQPDQLDDTVDTAAMSQYCSTESSAQQGGMPVSEGADSFTTDDGWSIVTPEDFLDASSATNSRLGG